MYFIFVILLVFRAGPAGAVNKVDASFSILAASEPVSIDDMITGWDGDYQRGIDMLSRQLY